MGYLDDDESVDENTFAVNRDEPSDDETDFGTCEEQKLRMEARIKELEEKERLNEKMNASDKNQLENLRILYNWRPWEPETEIQKEKPKKKGSKSKKKAGNSTNKV